MRTAQTQPPGHDRAAQIVCPRCYRDIAGLVVEPGETSMQFLKRLVSDRDLQERIKTACSCEAEVVTRG